MLLAGPPVVREDLGGELWFYYNACRFNMDADAHREHDGAAELHRLGITAAHFLAAEALCLAKLRPQGLVSLNAGRQGTLVSRPFVWPAGGQHALWLNVDAQWGEVFVEVVDVETAVAPLAGFGGRLLGSPVEVDDNMPVAAANSLSVAYGNFRQGYVVVNRSGTVLIRDNITAKGKTKFNFRRRFGGGVQNFEAIKLLKMAAS